MSQVRIGTVDVTNGSQVVTGSGTNWISSVSANDLFIIQGESVIYRIASVASDTQLSLSSNYVGATATALPYVVHVDFTGSGIPLMQDGDIETVSIYNIAVVSLEQGLSFGTYYLGAFAAAPTATGTGGSLTVGMMYFDTVLELLRVYNGSAWYDGAVSAAAAAVSAAEAAADAILTAADRVQTGLDRVQTTSDRIQTISDAAQTASDRVQTGLDRTQTNLDVTQTTLDAAATAADRVQTTADAVQTNLDVTQTILDAAQTASDRVQTGLDKTQTGLDRVQTTSDRIQTISDSVATAADRVQTGLDRAQTVSDAAQTVSDAAQTAADRVQTGTDATNTSTDAAQTASDRVQTTADAVQTASDRVQTGSDAAATAADRVQTGLDLDQTTLDAAQTASDRVQTTADAAQTALDRTDVNGVETRVLAIEVSINNTFDTFDDRFLGTFTTDPTHDNDGNAISVGAVYYNSVQLATKFYNGSSWDDPSQSASTSATNALNSENAAALSETNAAASESNAATSETNAAASESAASTSEGNAATSASASASSAAASSNSAAAAAASYDSFDDRFLGPKASDPTLDNDGNALLTGAIYWSTAETAMKVYTGSLWKLVTTVVEGVYDVTEYTDIAGQTTITIAYDVGLVQVLYNGVQLNLGDFTATNGTSIVLHAAVSSATDVITVIRWGAVTTSTFLGTAATKNTGVTTGTLPFAEDVVLIQPSGKVGIGTAVPTTPLQVQLSENTAGTFQTNFDIKRYWTSGSATARVTGMSFSDFNSISAGIYANRHTSDLNYQSDLGFYTNAGSSDLDPSVSLTKRMTITSAGNVGIGLTPSAWFANSKVLQIASGVSIEGRTNDGSTMSLGANYYLDSAATYRYLTNEAAERYTQNGSEHIWFSAPSGLTNNAISWQERMRIDSAGNLLVGKTAIGAASDGFEARANGFTAMSDTDGAALNVNRNGTDGALQYFYKSGTTVGSIGTIYGYTKITSGDGVNGSGLFFGAGKIYPVAANSVITDNAIDIGDPNLRFKDLHLSGGVVFGDAGGSGTGSSNTLDSYEEGTFTPIITAGGTTTAAAAFSNCNYVKVGNLVTLSGYLYNIVWADITDGGSIKMANIPFQVEPFAAATLAHNNTNISELRTNSNDLIFSRASVYVNQANNDVTGDKFMFSVTVRTA